MFILGMSLGLFSLFFFEVWVCFFLSSEVWVFFSFFGGMSLGNWRWHEIILGSPYYTMVWWILWLMFIVYVDLIRIINESVHNKPMLWIKQWRKHCCVHENCNLRSACLLSLIFDLIWGPGNDLYFLSYQNYLTFFLLASGVWLSGPSNILFWSLLIDTIFLESEALFSIWFLNLD